MAKQQSATVKVCLRCGWRGVRVAGVHEGGDDDGTRWVCDRCGHWGEPLLMDSDAAPHGDERWDQA